MQNGKWLWARRPARMQMNCFFPRVFFNFKKETILRFRDTDSMATFNTHATCANIIALKWAFL